MATSSVPATDGMGGGRSLFHVLRSSQATTISRDHKADDADPMDRPFHKAWPPTLGQRARLDAKAVGTLIDTLRTQQAQPTRNARGRLI
jgi:hypothetical protein